jgi:hypothetical protein
MLRSVTLGVALSVLAAACALIEPPAPPGTTAIQVQVRNITAQPVEIFVKTPAGPLHGAAPPGSVPAWSTTDVTLHLPLGQEYALSVGGFHRLGPSVDEFASTGCRLDFEITSDGLRMSCLDS